MSALFSGFLYNMCSPEHISLVVVIKFFQCSFLMARNLVQACALETVFLRYIASHKATIGPFIRGKIRRVLAKSRLILDKMYRLYGKFASYLRRVLCKTRLIFPRINGPNVHRF